MKVLCLENCTNWLELVRQAQKVPSGYIGPMWHGTDQPISNFNPMGDIGVHVGTLNQAKNRIEQKKLQSNPLFYQVYIPKGRYLELNDIEDFKSAYLVSRELANQGIISDEELDKLIDVFDTYGYEISRIRQLLQRKGYIGIKYINEFEGSGNDYSYVVFDPASIKIVNVLSKD